MKGKSINRRDFLKSIIRIGVLGGLISLGIALGHRNSSKTMTPAECPVNTACEQCCRKSTCTKISK